MIRFTPARSYLTAAAVALGLAAFSGWCALSWLPASIPAALFLSSAAFIVWLATRPLIEVTDSQISVGKRVIRWMDIRRVDQTGWVAPMVADLTLADNSRLRLVYPGEKENSKRLLRILQQRSTQALINGVPHRQIFGELVEPPAKEPMPSPQYRLLNEDEEAEIERLYQKLRTAGRLDPEK